MRMRQTSSELITGTDSELSEYNGSVMNGMNFLLYYFFFI